MEMTESVTINEHPDVKAKLSQLAKEKEIPDFLKVSMIQKVRNGITGK